MSYGGSVGGNGHTDSACEKSTHKKVNASQLSFIGVMAILVGMIFSPVLLDSDNEPKVTKPCPQTCIRDIQIQLTDPPYVSDDGSEISIRGIVTKGVDVQSEGSEIIFDSGSYASASLKVGDMKTFSCKFIKEGKEISYCVINGSDIEN